MINEDFGLIPLPEECPSTSTESPMSINSSQNSSQNESQLIPLPEECPSTSTESPISINSLRNSSQNDSQSSTPEPTTIKTSSKGVENAKKMLRAFSIQKKGIKTAPVIAVPKPTGSGGSTVVIGKLAPKTKTPSKLPMYKPLPETEESKKIPKPPKPGQNLPYLTLQKQTLEDIENMKLKIEMVELGIPLGLICPSQSAITKAMPTKAMPPIKNFLEPHQLQEIIKDAKKVRAEGKEYKFDYQKLLPGYDNPFQRKKDEDDTKFKKEKDRDRFDRLKSRYSRDYDYKRSDRKSKRDKRDKSKEREKDKKDDKAQGAKDKDDVILNEYVVCDSWSLENDEKSCSSQEKEVKIKGEVKNEHEGPEPNPMDKVRENLTKQGVLTKPVEETLIAPPIQKPKIEIILEPAKKSEPAMKMEKLQPVTDSFTYEIDPKDEALDIFDEEVEIEKFSKKTEIPDDTLSIGSKNTSIGDDNDEFLESIINDINQEESQDSYNSKYDKKKSKSRSSIRSVTPDLDDSMRASSSRSSCSEITSKSLESGYKSVDSYKSCDSSRSSSSLKSYEEKDINQSLIDKMSNATVESLETWSFVMKICQPLLFRHDKNKCYKETKNRPKLWYTDNPKCCDCVKDRSIVYEELELCKNGLVEAIYGNESMDPAPPLKSMEWYGGLSRSPPVPTGPPVSTGPRVHLSADWEDSPPTPTREQDPTLDQEYQRFMDAVWPEITEPARSPSTPVKEKKRKRERESEGWSQESDIENQQTKKLKAEKDKKNRKRKRSVIKSDSDKEDDKKKKKAIKVKISKKHKALLAKQRRLEKKYLKCLKSKQKKKAKKFKIKLEKLELESNIELEKNKKAMKKKSKDKKRVSKKKKKEETSTSSSSTSESEDDKQKKKDGDKSKKKKKRDKKRKKRQQSTSESTQSDELFDTDILNNIKTEKLSDTEKHEFSTQDFSPRRIPNKPSAEIINMKELQNDFESNNMMVKKESEGTRICEENEPQDEHTMPESAKEINLESIEEIPLPSSAKPIPTISSVPQSIPIPTLASTAKTIPTLPSKLTLDQATNADEYYANKDLNTSGVDQQNQYSQDYEMYEQMAMEYQNNVAKTDDSSVYSEVTRHIETVVSGPRGEIKYDWRPNVQQPATSVSRPSRWGLKPSDVNIILTGPDSHMKKETQVYQIKSVLEQNTSNSSYDEAYADMYAASDRLQYGDCFGGESIEGASDNNKRVSLDDRINKVLTQITEEKNEQETAEKSKSRVKKSVSFADGFKPGQDSDSEKPPGKKRTSPVFGCGWPCPLSHPAHVPLWDCLPPPPPPKGEPPYIYYLIHNIDPNVSLPEPPPAMMLQTAM